MIQSFQLSISDLVQRNASTALIPTKYLTSWETLVVFWSYWLQWVPWWHSPTSKMHFRGQFFKTHTKFRNIRKVRKSFTKVRNWENIRMKKMEFKHSTARRPLSKSLSNCSPKRMSLFARLTLVMRSWRVLCFSSQSKLNDQWCKINN